jgi:hypothetical protein
VTRSDPRRAIAPKLVRTFVQLGGDETRQRPEGAHTVPLDETSLAAIGDNIPKPRLLHIFAPIQAALDDRVSAPAIECDVGVGSEQ